MKTERQSAVVGAAVFVIFFLFTVAMLFPFIGPMGVYAGLASGLTAWGMWKKGY